MHETAGTRDAVSSGVPVDHFGAPLQDRVPRWLRQLQEAQPKTIIIPVHLHFFFCSSSCINPVSLPAQQMSMRTDPLSCRNSHHSVARLKWKIAPRAQGRRAGGIFFRVPGHDPSFRAHALARSRRPRVEGERDIFLLGISIPNIDTHACPAPPGWSFGRCLRVCLDVCPATRRVRGRSKWWWASATPSGRRGSPFPRTRSRSRGCEKRCRPLPRVAPLGFRGRRPGRGSGGSGGSWPWPRGPDASDEAPVRDRSPRLVNDRLFGVPA